MPYLLKKCIFDSQMQILDIIHIPRLSSTESAVLATAASWLG